MLLSDSEIREAMEEGRITIEPFSERNLERASYDLRIGKWILVSGKVDQIDLERKRGITIKAGQYAH